MADILKLVNIIKEALIILRKRLVIANFKIRYIC
jgi:hypothetical protein